VKLTLGDVTSQLECPLTIRPRHSDLFHGCAEADISVAQIKSSAPDRIVASTPTGPGILIRQVGSAMILLYSEDSILSHKRWICTAVLAASALSLIATNASADSACDKPRNDFDGLYCLSKVYQQSDVDLNSAFTQLRDKLDEKGKETLRISQLAWLKTRDQSCSRHDNSGFYVNLVCATQTTIKRTEFLQSRYRECISSGCLNSRLN
jgi:uncharacterized protein YecT (DUF1311 family)